VWNKTGTASMAPNILACINHSNMASRWFATLILREEIPPAQAIMVSFLISVAMVRSPPAHIAALGLRPTSHRSLLSLSLSLSSPS